ncbi:MAG TPA: recombinase family protein [Actinomycetes bacterium]|nr:recombinase family protein [Actinomycetes bacterium]
MGHLLGFTRVSTTDQQPQLQVDALQRAGCYRVFAETASGAGADRPVLEQVLDQLRPGDTLVVWKLDRPGRSLRHLVDTVAGLAERGVGFRSLQEAIRASAVEGAAVVPLVARRSQGDLDILGILCTGIGLTTLAGTWLAGQGRSGRRRYECRAARPLPWSCDLTMHR